MQALLWVAVGSAIGGTMRFWVSGVVARLVGETFPWGTLAVNVTGAFAIGLFAAASLGGGMVATLEARHLVMTGILGSYTTVSSFSLQTLSLARDGEWPQVLGNIALSLALCLGAVCLGFAAGGAMFAR
ncbi:MAG TPA: fluoride efflux transporter CrcB [Geminicoccaceae bacterium]|nr:fluoride efflux transporter CrcB [Geminicoccaceae bacterium]